MNSSLSWPEPVLKLQDGLGLLFLRLWVGQEFLFAGYTKLAAGFQAPEWFAGLAFPFPQSLLSADVNWMLAGAGELTLAAALILGLYTRWAALGLLYVTYVAVHTVHFDLGWAGWNQIETEMGLGFKLPLMLAVMLLALLTQGAGRYSIDRCKFRHPARQRTTLAA